MAGLEKNFIPHTTIFASQVNNNFTVIDTWDVKNEDLTSQIDGINLIFTTVYPYVPGSLIVLVDGIRQRKPTHYTETGASTFTFGNGYQPVSQQDLVVDYRRADL